MYKITVKNSTNQTGIFTSSFGLPIDSIIYYPELGISAVTSSISVDSDLLSTNNTKSIFITREQAITWYRGSNETLKKLALQAYSEKELKVTLADIFKEVPSSDFDPLSVETTLKRCAKYFNGTWKHTSKNNGYFISKHDDCATYPSFYGVDIKFHSSVVYQGIVYFKNREDLETTIRLIGEKQLKELW